MNNDQQFMEMVRETFPDLYIILEMIQKGRLSTTEVADVVHKMAIVRTSDDGYGKILIEMQTKPHENYLRVRTLQDKVVRTPKDFEEVDI